VIISKQYVKEHQGERAFYLFPEPLLKRHKEVTALLSVCTLDCPPRGVPSTRVETTRVGVNQPPKPNKPPYSKSSPHFYASKVVQCHRGAHQISTN
jgi:hypothetical protein